jgi:hypothetical protein
VSTINFKTNIASPPCPHPGFPAAYEAGEGADFGGGAGRTGLPPHRQAGTLQRQQEEGSPQPTHRIHPAHLTLFIVLTLLKGEHMRTSHQSLPPPPSAHTYTHKHTQVQAHAQALAQAQAQANAQANAAAQAQAQAKAANEVQVPELIPKEGRGYLRPNLPRDSVSAHMCHAITLVNMTGCAFRARREHDVSCHNRPTPITCPNAHAQILTMLGFVRRRYCGP